MTEVSNKYDQTTKALKGQFPRKLQKNLQIIQGEKELTDPIVCPSLQATTYATPPY